MRPEESENVSDNLEVAQLLSHDCRTILKILREKKFWPLKSIFYESEMCSILTNFSSTFEKKWSFWLQTALEFFLEVVCTCSRYLKGPLRSGLSNAPPLVITRHTQTKWCKENKKRSPETPFEFNISRCFLKTTLYPQRCV